MFAAGETIKYKQLWVVFVCVCVFLTSVLFGLGPLGVEWKKKEEVKL